MSSPVLDIGGTGVIQPEALKALLQKLRDDGYRLVGPTVRERAIVYDTITSTSDLPKGITDEQGAATYRLKSRNDNAWFGFVVGQHSWKRFVYPSQQTLVQVTKERMNCSFSPANDASEKLALIGCRSCEIHALDRLDGVLSDSQYADGGYRARRRDNFVLAVNCTEPGGTCFCVSMNTGPRADHGFDLALTEVVDRKQHHFMVSVGTERGARYLNMVDVEPATDQHREAVDKLMASASRRMGRELDTHGIKELLQQNPEHRQWQDVAKRCLTCGNCTLVCPTCFCSTVEDVTNLDGSEAARVRRWDSCFSLDFSYVHGGSVRTEPSARYRHWITHKLANWHDQFGASGCVGCGRCITWCPVGIDITEEAKAIRAGDAQDKRAAKAKE